MLQITFLGDISLNDAYTDACNQNSKPFNGIKKELSNSFVVGNLECFAAGDNGENILKRPRLKTNVETLNFLKDLNLSLVSIANNHVYDMLDDGYRKTIDFLENNNIEYIGAGSSAKEASKPYIYKHTDVEYCFLSYVTRDTNPELPDDSKVYLNWFDEQKVIKDIKNYKKKHDYVILLLHWGGVMEGSYFPEFQQFKTGKNLLRNGADLIVGHHSHTLQPTFKDRFGKIYFSLGNFCFADVVFEGKTKYILNRKRFTESIILNASFTQSGVSFRHIPVQNKNLNIVKKNNLIGFKLRQLAFDTFLKYQFFSLLNYLYYKRIYKYLRLLKPHPELSYYQRFIRLIKTNDTNNHFN